MGIAAFVKDFKDDLEFTPMKGKPNVYFIRPRQEPDQRTEKEMTAKDWDKFEKDIADVFEQVP